MTGPVAMSVSWWGLVAPKMGHDTTGLATTRATSTFEPNGLH
jgi:hypothetical protein